jgi:hypothetical protein
LIDTCILLISTIGLQQGDEILLINGTLVEEMTTTEVVDIINGIEGDINVFAKKRGDVTPVASKVVPITKNGHNPNAVPISTKDGHNPNAVPVKVTGAGAPPGNGEWYSFLIKLNFCILLYPEMISHVALLLSFSSTRWGMGNFEIHRRSNSA